MILFRYHIVRNINYNEYIILINIINEFAEMNTRKM